MDKSMEQTVIDSLEALDRGEAIGEILSLYTDIGADLRPILETAARLTTLNLQPTVAAQAESREVFLTQAQAVKGDGLGQRRRPFFSFWLRTLVTAVCLVIVAAGFINISARTLPGDTLYGTKLFMEGARLSLTNNGATLEERFRQNRILEIEKLLRQNRQASVGFTGVIDEMMDDTWCIEGLLVATAAANRNGEPQVGDVVAVTGWVANGRLVANDITVTTKNAVPTTPEAPMTPSATPTAEVTGETAVPTQTVNNRPMPTVTITPTPTAAATAVLPTPAPDPSPDPIPTHEEDDGGSNDGGDDNSGSGGGDDNSGSGSDNSGSGSDGNSGSGSDHDNSGSGSDDNSGSGSDDDNSGSGSSNSGSGDDDNSGSGSGGND